MRMGVVVKSLLLLVAMSLVLSACSTTEPQPIEQPAPLPLPPVQAPVKQKPVDQKQEDQKQEDQKQEDQTQKK